MPRLHLTERALAKLKAPDPSGKQVAYWDTELRGFGVLISGTSNARTFVVQRDVAGVTRRAKVAAVAGLPIAKARAAAAEMLLDLAKGISPRMKAEANMTLRGALEGYLAARRDLRPASVRLYRSVERLLLPWLDRPLRTITPDMVERKHRELAERHGQVMANAAMRVFRILWNHAAERLPDLPDNPVRRLKRQWFKEERRTRMVPVDQLPAFYRALLELPNQIARDALLLLLFTGMRKSEVCSLRWQDIDLKQRLIRLPASATKAGRELVLPMSGTVFDLLVARRALGRDRFVFPAPGKVGHISDLHRPLQAVAKTTGITISPHDLRRGYITTAESAGIPVSVIKRLVNHAASGDVTLGYVIVDDARLCEAAEAIATRLQALCGVEEPTGENVEKLARK